MSVSPSSLLNLTTPQFIVATSQAPPSNQLLRGTMRGRGGRGQTNGNTRASQAPRGQMRIMSRGVPHTNGLNTNGHASADATGDLANILRPNRGPTANAWRNDNGPKYGAVPPPAELTQPNRLRGRGHSRGGPTNFQHITNGAPSQRSVTEPARYQDSQDPGQQSQMQSEFPSTPRGRGRGRGRGGRGNSFSDRPPPNERGYEQPFNSFSENHPNGYSASPRGNYTRGRGQYSNNNVDQGGRGGNHESSNRGSRGEYRGSRGGLRGERGSGGRGNRSRGV